MAEIDLETMSLEDLRELRAQIDRAISSFTERRRRDAVAAAEEAIRKHGFNSLSEVTRRGRGGNRGGGARGGYQGGPGRGGDGDRQRRMPPEKPDRFRYRGDEGGDDDE